MYGIVEDEDKTNFLDSSGRLGVVNGRHRRTVIVQIKEEYKTGNGAHSWVKVRIGGQ